MGRRDNTNAITVVRTRTHRKRVFTGVNGGDVWQSCSCSTGEDHS